MKLIAAVPLLFFYAAPAFAELRPIRSTAEVEAGTLLLRTETGYVAAPAVKTEANIRITGMVARTEVIQRFTNGTSGFIEGKYVFPLPEGAAVDRLRLQIGERTIEGQIHEKAEAVKIFEQAKAEGKKASLLEQERPNMFTTSVANIGPNEAVVVRIEYQETIRYDQGKFSLRFPMAITPRYTPASGGFLNVTPSVPPSVGNIAAQAASITVDLDAGFELADVASLYHSTIVKGAADHRQIRLAGDTVPPDRDFVLEWRPHLGSEPKAAFFHEGKDGDTYGLLMLMPPAAESIAQKRIARETIFIIDSSGSMEGVSMLQAKKALALAIGQLQNEDTFEVIDFDDVAKPLFRSPQVADADHKDQAIKFVESLQADGGTNMSSALERALDANKVAGPGPKVRQIVFVTDGAVGNEMELYRMIKDRLGKSRLYTVGIGSAPNSWFMKEAAEAGRGTYTFIGDVTEVQSKMGELFRKIESPVLSDLSLVFAGAPDAEMFPDRLPDLYAGEPITVAVRFKTAPKSVTVHGLRQSSSFESELNLEGVGARSAGLGKLWARSKIEALTDRITMGTPEIEVRPEILRVALDHELVSPYTSLVAVDTTPSRPATEPLALADAPEPAYAQAMPQGGTEAELSMIVGVLLAAMALWLVRQPRRA